MDNSEKTIIANPLYDVVFRYMMEDNKVAKLFLSAIIGEQIKDLKFNPTEYSSKLIGELGITVIRMDFNARIQKEDGTEKIVIIELQKAKFYYQAMRFRRYLGKQYQNPQNVSKDDVALPILPIYILGESFTKEKIPVIKVQRNYMDVATSEIIAKKHPFIEALTHDAIVIQVPYLKNSRRTVLEQFLSIFDQSSQTDATGHILALDENNYPEKYRPIIQRLHKAILSPQMENEMDLEDDIISEFNKQAELTQKEREAKYKLIRNLAKAGMTNEEIARAAEMEIDEINDILNMNI